MFIVYKTTNVINNKIYIGVHNNGDSSNFDGYLGSGLNMTRAIKKYGKENFIRETLKEFDTIEESFEYENQLVTEEFVLREDTYNLSTGGKGYSGLGEHVVSKQIGIHSPNYTFEDRSAVSKANIANMDPEKRYNMCKSGGLIGGKKSVENKSGIFSDDYTDEMRQNASKLAVEKQKELGINRFSSSYQSEMGKRGGVKNKGFIWINNGEKSYKYTVKQQEELSVTDLLSQNDNYKLGRIGIRKYEKPTMKGCLWYTDGSKDYRYTKKQQEELSLNEFIDINPIYKIGRFRNNFRDKQQKNLGVTYG